MSNLTNDNIVMSYHLLISFLSTYQLLYAKRCRHPRHQVKAFDYIVQIILSLHILFQLLLCRVGVHPHYHSQHVYPNFLNSNLQSLHLPTSLTIYI